MVSAVSCVCSLQGFAETRTGRGTASVSSFTVACGSHVKSLLLSCGTRRGVGSREQGEQEHQPVHSPCSSPNAFEGAAARNGSSKGILEVHRAFKGHFRYTTLVWHIFVL